MNIKQGQWYILNHAPSGISGKAVYVIKLSTDGKSANLSDKPLLDQEEFWGQGDWIASYPCHMLSPMEYVSPDGNRNYDMYDYTESLVKENDFLNEVLRRCQIKQPQIDAIRILTKNA